MIERGCDRWSGLDRWNVGWHSCLLRFIRPRYGRLWNEDGIGIGIGMGISISIGISINIGIGIGIGISSSIGIGSISLG